MLLRPYLGTFLFYGFHSCNTVGTQQHTPYEHRRRRRMIFLCLGVSLRFLRKHLEGVCDTPLPGYELISGISM